MGNQSSNYTIEKFLIEFETSNINQIDHKEIREKFESVLSLFKQDKNYFASLKKEENRKADSADLKYQSENSDKDKSKTWKFCNMITFYIKINYVDKEIPNIILDIFSILIKEKEFLSCFMKNSLEELLNMIQVNELKQSLVFYQKVTKLFNDILCYMNTDLNLIIENLSGLRKMSSAAKMLMDTAFCKDKEIKLNLLNFLKENLEMLRNLYRKFRSDQKSLSMKELGNIVKLTINEYYNCTLFTRLSEDLYKKENANTIEMQKIIMVCFNLLAQFDFVISDQLINSEKEVEHSFYTIISKNASDDIVIETLKFLLNYYINSFNQECIENFKLFFPSNRKKQIEEKVFSIFCESKNDDVKFLISLIFMVVSSIENIWNRLSNLNLIKPTSKFIEYYIAETFKKSTYLELDSKYKRRFHHIEILFRIFHIISEERNFNKIMHTGFFKIYFDSVIILYHVYHPQYRLEILKTINVFTYFNDCKEKALKQKNIYIITFFHSRIEIVFKNIKKVYSIYESLNKKKNNLIEENRKSRDAEFYNKIMENIQILETSCEDSKNLFSKTLQEFGLLISIFINLMMSGDFQKSKSYLTQANPRFFEDYDVDKNNIKVNEQNKIASLVDAGNKSQRFTLSDYETFLKDIDEFLIELSNGINFIHLSKYTVQVVIARLICNPTGKFELKTRSDDIEGVDKEDEGGQKNIEILLDYLKYYKADHDIQHKLLYVIYRYLISKRNHKAVIDTLKKITEEVKAILFKDNKSSIIVNRESLRLLCCITTFSDNTLLWLKFDSKKVHVDHSNYSDVLLKYKDEEIDWDQDNPNKERIIFPPYLKVKSYADRMGVIFYGEHVLILPKKLHLGSNYTISFRFFNPVINSNKWHVLLQDASGVGGLIVIDNSKSKLGCFTIDGKFIDAAIDLNHPGYSNKWIHVALTYGIKSGPSYKNKSAMINHVNEQRILIWYVEGNETIRYEKQKIILPQTVQYIGNSRDFDEPFGVFCDIRIFPVILNNIQIKRIYSNEDSLKFDKNDDDITNYVYTRLLEGFISSFLETNDSTDETFYYTIKFLNNMFSEKSYRDKFINYNLIVKVLGFYSSKKIEIKKEISKFMMNIS